MIKFLFLCSSFVFACVLENTDVLVRYLCGAGAVDWTSSKEELATFLAWHDIPHPSHLSHISYQQGLYLNVFHARRQ